MSGRVTSPKELTSIQEELGALKRKQVWFTLGIGAIGFGGMFSVFSYIKPTLIEVAGLPLGGVPFVLALFGLGIQETNRSDIVQALLTGVPGLTQIGKNPAAADTLKINLATPPSASSTRGATRRSSGR